MKNRWSLQSNLLVKRKKNYYKGVKKMKKIITTFSLLIMTSALACASSIDSVINNSKVSKNATVAVSLRKLDSGRVVYEKNSQKLLNPASTLKAFTTPVIIYQLGDNYTLKTRMYKSGENVYLKLSGDPLLTSKDLNALVSSMREGDVKRPQKFYIDDTSMDESEYGIGWMWDNDVSHFMPKYSVYNLDGNVYSLKVIPDADKKTVSVKKPYSYNVVVINKLRYGTKNNIVVTRNYWEGVEKVILNGTVATPTTVSVSTYNPKRYFMSMLQDSMNNKNIDYYGSFESKEVPFDAVLLHEVANPVLKMYPQIMKNSNNMISETLFKVAGAKYTKTKATTANAVEAFKDYYKNLGVETDEIVVVDASGISRNDLLTTDWMSKALFKINKNDKTFNYKEYFNVPNEGTMVNRLFDLRDFLWAKTGTLANVSGLTGYITTQDGNEYAFAILIQNTNEPVKDVKKLEDEIITTIYKKY